MVSHCLVLSLGPASFKSEPATCATPIQVHSASAAHSLAGLPGVCKPVWQSGRQTRYKASKHPMVSKHQRAP